MCACHIRLYKFCIIVKLYNPDFIINLCILFSFSLSLSLLGSCLPTDEGQLFLKWWIICFTMSFNWNVLHKALDVKFTIWYWSAKCKRNTCENKVHMQYDTVFGWIFTPFFYSCCTLRDWKFSDIFQHYLWSWICFKCGFVFVIYFVGKLTRTAVVIFQRSIAEWNLK